METGRHVETGTDWGPERAWMERLIALARSAHEEEFTPERRAQIRERLLERLERIDLRRRRVRVFVAVASTLALAGLLLRLVRASHA